MNRQTRAGSGFGFGVATLAVFAAPVRADEKGERILGEAFKKINEAQSMTATLTQIVEGEGISKRVIAKGTVSAMKPNLLMVRVTTQIEGSEKSEAVYAATGKDYVWYDSAEKDENEEELYHKDKLAVNPTDFPGPWEGEIDAFFGGEKLLAKGKADYSGMDKVGDAACNIVKMTLPAKDKTAERVITYFVGQKDHLIHKTSWLISNQGAEITESNLLTDINFKATKKVEDFQYTPPKGVKLKAPPREIIF